MLVSVLAAVVTPAAWLIGLLVWQKGQILGGFYVLAWTPLLIGHLILAVSKLGVMPRSFMTEFVPQVGVALEVILLSFAMAYPSTLSAAGDTRPRSRRWLSSSRPTRPWKCGCISVPKSWSGPTSSSRLSA